MRNPYNEMSKKLLIEHKYFMKQIHLLFISHKLRNTKNHNEKSKTSLIKRKYFRKQIIIYIPYITKRVDVWTETEYRYEIGFTTRGAFNEQPKYLQHKTFIT